MKSGCLRIDDECNPITSYGLAKHFLHKSLLLLKNDVSFNLEYETKGTIVSDGYQVEFKIPFSSLPFPNGTNQKWNFNITRQAFRDGIPIDIRSQPFDRTDPCQVCQTTDKLILSEITIEKRVELLPYVAAGIGGEKDNIDGPITVSYTHLTLPTKA